MWRAVARLLQLVMPLPVTNPVEDSHPAPASPPLSWVFPWDSREGGCRTLTRLLQLL